MDISENNSIQNNTLANIFSELKLKYSSDIDSYLSSESLDGDEIKWGSSKSFSKQNLKGEDFEFLNSQLLDKIRSTIEYLLSDTHILKDKFLLKHMKRNKDGYINLKLISSLRKVKAFTKDWKIVAYSLEKSKTLQLNEEKTKIRRIIPIPNLEDDQFSSNKTLVLQLNEDFAEHTKVKKFLSSFGKIENITIVKCDSDFDKLFIAKINSLLKFEPKFPYALVKFNSCIDVLKAVRSLSEFEHCVIVPFLSENDKERKATSPISSNLNQNQNTQTEKEASCKLREKNNLRTKSSLEKINEKYIIPEDKTIQRKGKRHLKNGFEINGTDKLIVSSIMCTDEEKTKKWTQRRFLTKISPVFILRQPKGPDGTLGFHEGRSKANLASPKTSF